MVARNIFDWVEGSLRWLGRKTNLSYEAANIVVYYLVIPLSWICLLDAILHTHWLKVIAVAALGVFLFRVKSFEAFSSRLFDRSVDFLLFFGRFGLNYMVASVVICVVLPLLVYAALLALL